MINLKKIALQKGGKCHSNFYGNQDSILEFECQKGHRWSTRAGHKQSLWCHECGGSKPKTLEDMHKLVEQKGEKCLSKEFINVETILYGNATKNILLELTGKRKDRSLVSTLWDN